MIRRAILGVSAALVVACSGSSGPSATPASAPPVSTPERSSRDVPSSAVPSASVAPPKIGDITVGGDRPVTVHVPPGYDPARPAPLLIVLHGYGASGQHHDTYFRLGELVKQHGFLYAFPDGSKDDGGSRFWNATDACCDVDRRGVDDAGYLSDLITEIGTSLAVDPKRIYLVGHSNGGFMSYAMACAHADQIAAIVSLAGATFANPSDCAPTAPVAVLEIHGTADDSIRYKGGRVERWPLAAYPGAETSVATWAKYDGCARASVVDEHVDVDAGIGTAAAPAEASVTRWSGCRPGGAAELWTIPGGGHVPRISASFPAAVMDFLEAHPKP